MEEKRKLSKVKQIILAISIAIIFAFFVGYGIETFYESPKWEDFCDRTIVDINMPDKCVEIGGVWQSYETPEPPSKGGAIEGGWCDAYYTCEKEFDSVMEPYERNVFIITLIVGLLAVIIGGLFLSVEAVGSGIMSGGVLTLIYGTIIYWGDMSKYLRFIVLTIVLIILIVIGYKKFKK